MNAPRNNIKWGEIIGLRDEIRRFLESVKDEGTSIDSGGGMDCGDLWVRVQDTEYLVTIKSKSSRD